MNAFFSIVFVLLIALLLRIGVALGLAWLFVIFTGISEVGGYSITSIAIGVALLTLFLPGGK